MSSTSTPQILIDTIRDTAERMSLFYEEPATIACITAFFPCFNEGVTFWRTSDEYEDSIKYRFWTPSPINVLSIAFDAQLLDISHPLVPVLQEWLKPWPYRSTTDGSEIILTPEQRCEFDSYSGLRRVWALMGAARPLLEVLTLPEVPEDLTDNYELLIDLGFTAVRQLSVDLFAETVTLHFEPTSPFSYDELKKYLDVVRNFSCMEPYGDIDMARIGPKLMTDMERTLAKGYTVEITIALKGHEGQEEYEDDPEGDEESEIDEEEESESEPSLNEEPMISDYMVDEHSDDEWEARSEPESEPEEGPGPGPLASGRGKAFEKRGYYKAKCLTRLLPGAIQYITFRAVAKQQLSLPRVGARLYKFLDLTSNYGGEEYTAVAFAFESGGFSFVHVEKVFNGRLMQMEGERTECDEVPDVEMGRSGDVTEENGLQDVEMGDQ